MSKEDKNKGKKEAEEIDKIIKENGPDDPYKDPQWSPFIPNTPRRRGGGGYEEEHTNPKEPTTDKTRRMEPPPETPRRR